MAHDQPTDEPSYTLEEFLKLTGGLPPKEAPEVVAERRRRFLEDLDPDDDPF